MSIHLLGAIGFVTYPVRLAKWKIEEPRDPRLDAMLSKEDYQAYMQNHAVWLARRPSRFTW